jgi:glycosyltransferase involved in cell wall biosynthesis
MKIGIDARFYGSLGKGLGRYTQQLILYLEKIDLENDYYIFLRKENWADYQPRNKRFIKVLADYRWYSFTEQFFMPIKIWILGLDIMHFTHFNVPLFYIGKFIVTIHDLILIKYPTERASTLSPLLYKIKHFGYRMIIKKAVKRARKIIAVSKYTKQEIVKYFQVDAKKIYVTYEGVDPFVVNSEDTKIILNKYKVIQPYLLYVGNVYPHKNIEGLLTAFQQLVKIKPNLNLVIVGKDDYFFTRIKREVRLKSLEKNIIFTGFVTDHDLPYLYKGAGLYVFPSFCEGFGLPALEACFYGVPVIASNNSSLPEVLGNAAVYFNPHNSKEMFDKILYVLDNPAVGQQLIERGYEQVKQFSWKKMAKTTQKLYQDV